MPAAAPRRTRRLAMATGLLIAALLVQGCATGVPSPEQPKVQERTASAGPRTRTVITPALRAELDAAMALVKAEQYEPGLKALEALSAKMPDNPIPLINMALVRKQLGQLDKAEAALKQALDAAPGDPLASNELALLYRQSGRFAEARPLYEEVLARYPNFAMMHKNLGVLCDLYLRDYECALCHYKRFSAIAPDDKDVKIWIADLQKRQAAK